MADKAESKTESKIESKPAGRPLGVTIICVLGFLGAILGILGGLGLSALGSFMPVPVLGALSGIIGGALIILGIVSLVVIWWVWQMKKLGWTIFMVLQIISILLSLVMYNWYGLVIPVILVIYMWLKKDLFK